MFDITHIFMGSALAQTTAAPAHAPVPGPDLFGPQAFVFLVILGIFYFLLIRPQQQKFEAHSAMVKALQKGDRVITAGGIVGTVTKLEGDDEVTIEIADGVSVKVLRQTITDLADKKGTVAKDKNKDAKAAGGKKK